MKIYRHYVTLLELLIVMAIISVVGGAIAIGIRSAYVQQSFRTEVSLVVDELRLAQDLMLILGTNVHVKFAEAEDNKGINFWLETETPIQSSLEGQMLKKTRVLKTVRGFFFADRVNEATESGVSDVAFKSKGMVMSKGIIRLATSSEQNAPSTVLEAYIPLAGYPRPIVSVDDGDAAEAMYKSFDDQSADQNLTTDTFAKIPERKAKKKDEKEKKETDTEKSTPNRKTNPQDSVAEL